jgi:hypothetical protein
MKQKVVPSWNRRVAAENAAKLPLKAQTGGQSQMTTPSAPFYGFMACPALLFQEGNTL